jgi:hypothetical protein
VANVVLLVVALIISLLVVELMLRFLVGLGDPLLYRPSPLFGYRLQENQLVQRRGIEIRVNNLGLRAEADWDSSRSGKVLFLGNSVTFGGTYLANTELFSHHAVAGLKGVVSGNGGVNGWGVENIHALIVGGDFLPASTYVTVLQDMDFDRGLSKFAGQPFWIRKPVCALEELAVLAAFHLFQVSKDGYEESIRPDEREKGVERAVLRLKEMDEFLRAKGFVHLIYMSTDTHQLLDGLPADTVVAKYLRLSGLRVSYLADSPEIRGLAGTDVETLFYDWNHLDKEGHRLWGKLIGRDLERVFESGETAF